MLFVNQVPCENVIQIMYDTMHCLYPFGVRAAQKAPKGKAGYELYSSDSEDHQQECGDGLLGHNGPLRTMVEEWMARQGIKMCLCVWGDAWCNG